MNKINKSLIFSLLISLSLVALPAVAASIFDQALSGFSVTSEKIYGQEIPEGYQPVLAVISVINGLLTLVGIIFFLILVYGGFTWMNARGNQDEVGKAKRITREAIIGIIIIVSARVVTELILYQINQAALSVK